MFNYDYRESTNVGRVCLELSLKPFRKLDDDYIETVCRSLFDKWRDLLLYATSASILFWTSDGSEILDYSGNLDDEFEWCRYIGIGNPLKSVITDDPNHNNHLHVVPIMYMENPPVFRYRDLKKIVSTLKRVGKEMTGLEIAVGETFDPGPEFAYSAFKYERHPEIAKGSIMGANQWVNCASTLHADTHHYAGYPDGIPEGTHFGEFLGRQFKHLKDDIGFDYIWLSNGLGYALDAWEWTGELFDGKCFNFENAAAVRDSISEFWTHFSKEIGDTVVETRGSNLSTGMDIAAHGCPIDEIYKYNVTAPPNSPWAAMDYRFGLEFCGFMSHIANLPKNGYLFRFYSHDPWWYNSPWFDRYGRSPHDIYLPLAIARLDENANVTKPRGISFLSADDSFGEIPRKGAIEMTPPILEGYDDYSDAPGLVTWVYPFDYYCKLGLRDGKLSEMMMDDWFIESAIDYGMPINTVISDTNFIKAPANKFKETVLLMPVPHEGTNLEAVLNKIIENNLKVILYGDTSLASEKLKKLIGVTCGKGKSGEFSVETNLSGDSFENGSESKKLFHDSIVSNGDICEKPLEDSNVKVSVTSSEDGEKFAYATFNNNIFWVRGSFPHKRVKAGHLPPQKARSNEFAPAALLRYALSMFGYTFLFKTYDVNDSLPIIFDSRKNSAHFFTGFSKNATTKVVMSYPDGAPVCPGTEFIVKNSIGIYETQKSWHRECRTFVKQEKESKITCMQMHPLHPFYADFRILLNGLIDAEVTFVAPEGYIAFFSQTELTWQKPELEVEKLPGNRYCVKHMTGRLAISWVEKEKREGEYQKLKFYDAPVEY